MALGIDKGHTALLPMDFENDIVHENGAFKDFGFAAMVKQNNVLVKSARLLDAARRRPCGLLPSRPKSRMAAFLW